MERKELATDREGNDGRQTIEVWHHFLAHGSECLAEVFEAWLASQGEYEIKTRIAPETELNERILAAQSEGSAPDVVLIDNSVFPLFASAGALLDISDRVATWGQSDQYYRGHWQTTMWKGRNYGVPFGTATLALWINDELANGAGLDVSAPPKDWGDLEHWARKLTNRSRSQFGLAFTAKGYEGTTYQWLPFLWGNGADLDSLVSQEAVGALQLWVDLMGKGYVCPDVLDLDQSSLLALFIRGTIAMMVNGSWNVATIRKRAPGMKWTIAPLPYQVHPAQAIAGENWAILADTQRAEGAWDLIRFSQERAILEKCLLCDGRLPCRRDLAEQSGAWASDPAYRVFLEQLQYGRPRGPVTNWPSLSGVLQSAIREALAGAQSAEQGLKDAAARIVPLLRAGAESSRNAKREGEVEGGLPSFGGAR
jgi:multiple sugar transport system substrate-binding protein